MLKKTLFAIATVLLCAGPATAQNLTLDQVLAKHYEAIGGLDNWQKVQSFQATGRMALMPGTEAPFVMTAKRPLKVRIEFTLQGMTGIQAFDGTTAWMVMPFMGKTEPEPMPPEMSKDIIEQGDIDGPLIGYQEDGHRVELVGTADMEGTKTYQIKVTLKSGDVQHYYLDAEHFVTIKIEGRRTMQGTTVDFEQILSDYKEVGGLMMPYSMEARPKGAPAGSVITIERVELDIAVDDAIFAMPKPAK